MVDEFLVEARRRLDTVAAYAAASLTDGALLSAVGVTGEPAVKARLASRAAVAAHLAGRGDVLATPDDALRPIADASSRLAEAMGRFFRLDVWTPEHNAFWWTSVLHEVRRGLRLERPSSALAGLIDEDIDRSMWLDQTVGPPLDDWDSRMHSAFGRDYLEGTLVNIVSADAVVRLFSRLSPRRAAFVASLADDAARRLGWEPDSNSTSRRAMAQETGLLL